MADKSVGELIAAQSVTPTDLFVLEQNGTAKKLTGQILENWLVSFADGHGGIQSIKKLSTSGLADTYRITLADTTPFDFVVTNGRSITGTSKTSTSGLVDTYTITYNNGPASTFTVKNGEKGDKGDNVYVWIKYSSQKPTESSHSMGDIPDDWIGIYYGNASTAPTDWKQYQWFKHKGEKGDTGSPATLATKSVTYQVGDSGTIIPSGSWGSSIPVVSQGKYLWTKTELRFNTGDPIVSYSVARMGIDGTGSVSSVAGVSPDATGNVTLAAADVGALAVSGGDMTGAINMNGQPISGLNMPTANDHVANMGFVNQQVKKAAPRNFLDDSDFTNLIAQAGILGKHGKEKYFADRWVASSANLIYDKSSRIITFPSDEMSQIRQAVSGRIPGKTVTLAIKASNVNGKVSLSESGAQSGHADVQIQNGITTHTFTAGDDFNVVVWSNSGASICIDWLALYEGEYTAENLPEYQPKGYGAELLECMRYYRKIARNNYCLYYSGGVCTSETTINFALCIDPPMRIAPTVLFNGGFAVNSSSFQSATLNANDRTPDGVTILATTENMVKGYSASLQDAGNGSSIELIADR